MRVCTAVFLLALCSSTGWSADAVAASTHWSVYFSPQGGCTEAVVEALGQSKTTVLVQAYTFTSSPIAKALVKAHRRGVKVEVVLDESQRTERYSLASVLHTGGVPCFFDAQHTTAHNKVMVIDGQTVITGSFNFTKAAEESKAENLLVIQDADLAAKYTQNWQIHRQHSEPYAGLAADKQPKSKSRNQ
jgi:phosphatidylserine/phosphatidylglycerophosphate/cardiolipin synthase-like enzyme